MQEHIWNIYVGKGVGKRARARTYVSERELVKSPCKNICVGKGELVK